MGDREKLSVEALGHLLERFFRVLHSAKYTLSKIINFVGHVGIISNFAYFFAVLVEVKNGVAKPETMAQVIAVVVFFVISYAFAKWDSQTKEGLEKILWSVYGLIITIILIVSFFSSVEVITKVGLDFSITAGPAFLLDLMSSAYLTVIIMYVIVFTTARYIIFKESPEVARRVSFVPLLCVFLWLLFDFVGKNRIAQFVTNDMTSGQSIGNITIAVMGASMVEYGRYLLKGLKSSDN